MNLRIALIVALVVIAAVNLNHRASAAETGDTVTISKSDLQKLIQQEVKKALAKEKKSASTPAPTAASGAAAPKPAPTGSAASSTSAPPPSSPQTVRDVDSQGLFAVPNSPAASALGMNPDTLPRATLPKQLGMTNLNGIDVRGNPQTGLAVDVSVGQLFMLRNDDKGLTVKEYSSKTAFSYMERLLMRSQISFAETRGTSSADKSLKLALGVMIPLLVAHDPAQIAGDSKGTAEVNRNRLFQSLPENVDMDKTLPSIFQNSMFTGMAANMYRHLDLAVGAYALGDSPDGQGSNLKYGGSAVYGTLDFSINNDMPVLFVTNVTYRDHQQVPSSTVSLAGSSMLVPEDSLLLGLGIQFGTKTINATAFWAWIKEWETNNKSEYSNRYGVLAEYHLPKGSFLGSNAFITLSAGEEIGGGDRPSSSFVLGGVKIGLGGDDFQKLSNDN